MAQQTDKLRKAVRPTVKPFISNSFTPMKKIIIITPKKSISDSSPQKIVPLLVLQLYLIYWRIVSFYIKIIHHLLTRLKFP
jgi:hypothetical protein